MSSQPIIPSMDQYHAMNTTWKHLKTTMPVIHSPTEWSEGISRLPQALYALQAASASANDRTKQWSSHHGANPYPKSLSSSEPHPGTWFWHSFWHAIWKYIYIYRIAYRTVFLAYILTFFLAFYLASFLTYFRTYVLLASILISVWHLFWHSIWHIFWHSFLASILASLLTFFLSFYSAFHCHSIWGDILSWHCI